MRRQGWVRLNFP